MPRSLPDLQAAAVRLLGTYQDTPVEVRTPVVRKLAEVFVEARGHFFNDNSQPDYKGMTHNYRHWVSECYDLSHIKHGDVRSAIQASVRYHAGTVLREVLDEETLDELGLMRQSPKDRSMQRRSDKLALLNMLVGRSSRSDSEANELRVKVEYAMLTEDVDALVEWINATYQRNFKEAK